MDKSFLLSVILRSEVLLMPTYGPQMTVNDVIQISSICKSTDQVGMNVFHYLVTGVNAGATNNLSKLAEALQTADFPAKMKALISTHARYSGLLIRVLHPTLSLNFPDTIGAGDGTAVGDLLPRQVSGFIRKRSAEAGRRKGGRFYVPFPAEDDSNVDSTPTDNYLIRLASLAAMLASNMT